MLLTGHSGMKYLLTTCNLSSIVLGPRDRVVNKTILGIPYSEQKDKKGWGLG